MSFTSELQTPPPENKVNATEASVPYRGDDEVSKIETLFAGDGDLVTAKAIMDLKASPAQKRRIARVLLNHATRMENYAIRNKNDLMDVLADMEIQAHEATDAEPENDEVFWKFVVDRVNKFFVANENSEWLDPTKLEAKVALFVENIFYSWWTFKHTDNYGTWLMLTYRLFMDKSAGLALTKLLQKFFTEEETTEVQAGTIADGLHSVRKLFDTVTDLGSHPILCKFHKLYTHLLVQGFLKNIGMTLNEEEYSKFEIHALNASSSGRRGLWLAAFDVLLFLAEKSYEFYDTKDVSVFLHTSSEYAEWLKESDRLISLSSFTGNLRAHGTSYFAYVDDLNKAIEKGDAYVKYAYQKANYESGLVQKRVQQLKFIKATTATKTEAQKSRVCPLGVLIAGRSGIGKTTIENMLFQYHAHLRHLPCTEEAKYTRNPLAEYWTNFDSDKWCILLDDVAFMDPRKSADIDPTLKELILIINGVSYAPAQAALEDKGKTPVLAELVIATTNTIHLHAKEYFSDPLAVQRRLPYVVVPEVKAEFRKQDSHMLDARKCTTRDGEYPNWWRFEIFEIVPQLENGREIAVLKSVRMYSEVDEFLADFGKTIQCHFRNQDAFLANTMAMSNITICEVCLAPSKKCKCPSGHPTFTLDLHVNAGEMVVRPPVLVNDVEIMTDHHWAIHSFPVWQRFGMWLLSWYSFFVFWFMTCRLGLKMLHWALYFRSTRWLVYRAVMWYIPNSIHVKVLGLMNSISNLPSRWKSLSRNTKLLVGVVSVAVGAYAIHKASPKKATSIPQISDLDPQGNKFNTTEEQLKKEQRQNVWYNPTVETAASDLTAQSTSLKGVGLSELVKVFQNNVVRLHVSFVRGTETVHRTLGGIYVSGQYLLTQPHLFSDDVNEYTVELIQGAVADGVTPNLTFSLSRDEIAFDKDHELCMFKTVHNQPKRSIEKYWLIKDDLTINQMFVFERTNHGQIVTKTVNCVQYHDSVPIQDLGIVSQIYLGKQDVDSENGNCGSLALANVPRGIVLCGMHLLGRKNTVGIQRIPFHLVKNLMALVDKMDIFPLTTQAGDFPRMSCGLRKHVLGPIDARSKVRYLEEGTVKIYGSFTGLRNHPKSAVCATPLQDVMMEHFGVTELCVPPVLSGYEIWRKNLVEMVKPFCRINRAKIDRCARSYLADILTGLPKNWEKDLVFLSKRAAVNGLPGVQYIDGINRSTSMGFPYCTSKDKYLEPDASAEYPDGVTFGPEVWDEFERIVKECKQGKRVNPVFSGNPKDEAVPEKKRRIKKTRIFTGSPVEWSLFVRSRLLPFIRLVQKNKFLFEAAPGVVCMSSEWGRMYEYLTAFGKKRLFAGDYGRYDKSMIAYFILVAFSIIARVYLAAGFSVEECQEIMSIGYDTAFSWCNFDGDLIEFFGTNPSGHPLTVIINSIVNSLYMRYAYLETNPKHIVEDFKENVHLITYGDDNTAGVHERCPWFNHTSVSAVMSSIGITYTMADKESESVPYIDIDDVSFLKRKWRWDEDMQTYLCPLDRASIHKALTVWTASKTLTPCVQMGFVIKSMHDEFFFYGKKEFEEQHSFFQQVLDAEPMRTECDIHLDSWEELSMRFRRASHDIDREYEEYDIAHQSRIGCLIGVEN